METNEELPEGWKVYQGKDAFRPDLHKPEAWYFEPEWWGEGDVFSVAFRTRDAAVESCLGWIQWTMPMLTDDEAAHLRGES